MPHGQPTGGGQVGPEKKPPSVFISYSTRDRVTATRLRDELLKHRVAVRIDVDSVAAGESLRKFIFDSIRATELTVMLVSKDSLQSDWVGLETLSALWDEENRAQNRFVAGYLDDAFLALEFRDKAEKGIEARIKEIAALIQQRLERKRDIADLTAAHQRLHDLNAGLGKILERLREHLTLDLRGDQFGASVKRLLERLGIRALSQPAMAAGNIQARASAIRMLIGDNEIEEARKDFLQFVKEFGTDAQVRKATLLSGSFRRVEDREQDHRLDFRVAEELRNQIFEEMLILLDEVEESPTIGMAA